MPTNKQDKRDGPTTEERKPIQGHPTPARSSLLFLAASLPPSLFLSSLLSLLALFPSAACFLISLLLSLSPLWINPRSFPLKSKEKK